MTEKESADISEIPQWHHLPANKFNPHAWVIGEPDVGDGVWIGAFTVIDASGGLTIGPGSNVSAGAHIYTHSTVKRCLNSSPSEDSQPVERASVLIGSNVYIGANATILMGCEIGDQCVIGAGAVLKEFTKVPPRSLVVGVPAKIIEDGALKYSF